MFGFPFIKGHAVENLTRFHFADLDTPLGGGLVVPAAEAVPAESRIVHHVDILHIGPGPQMIAQTAKGGGFEFNAGGVVHGEYLRFGLFGYVGCRRTKRKGWQVGEGARGVRTGSFRDCLILAASLGGDSGTVASIAGQIAGRIYGIEGIPADWLAMLAWREWIEAMAADLFALGS